MTAPRTRSVSHQYFIRAPPGRVFRAISDPAGLTRWLADYAEMPRRRGGTYTLGWRDGPKHTGRILRFVPGKSVTFEWAWPGIDLKGTRLRLAVQPKRGGSLLRVEHSGFPRSLRWVDLYGGAEWGWTYFAMNLKSILETARDLRSAYDG